MNYTQEMNLQSKSGYCMPFEERKGEVRMSLDYGIQVHPKSGEEFFHHGIDFICCQLVRMESSAVSEVMHGMDFFR